MLRTFFVTTAISALLAVVAETGHAQTSPPEPTAREVLMAINEQVWIPFCESFAQNDAEAFLALHTVDAVRVSARPQDVKSGDAFREHTSKEMQQFKEAGFSFILTLRFTQRSHGDDAAFETGVYRFESKTGDYVGYGKFQVLLRKVDGQWKVALDADEPTDAAAFEAARSLEDVNWE